MTQAYYCFSLGSSICFSVSKVSEVSQSCLTLCDPLDCNRPGFSISGILQARILEWVAITSFKGSSLPMDQTYISYISCILGKLFYCQDTREALWYHYIQE